MVLLSNPGWHLRIGGEYKVCSQDGVFLVKFASPPRCARLQDVAERAVKNKTLFHILPSHIPSRPLMDGFTE